MSIDKKIAVTELLDKRIFIFKKPLTKQALLRELVQAVCKTDKQLDFKTVLAQIVQRESQMSTTLDTGLSIPHIRVDELDKAVAALAILSQPIAEKDGKQIKVMFLFLSPARSEFFQQHLQLLAALAETFTPDFVTQLARVSGLPQALDLLAAPSAERK